MFSVALHRSAACVFAKEGGGGGLLVAYVSSRKYNLRNWWSGTWCGRLVKPAKYSVGYIGVLCTY